MTRPESQRLPSQETATRETGRHRCRPVHPECAALSSKYDACTCRTLWGIDGNNPLPPPPVYARLDRQTKWGRHPDEQDLRSKPEASPSVLDAYESSISAPLEIDGFWKESEFRAQFVETPIDLQIDEKSLDKQE